MARSGRRVIVLIVAALIAAACFVEGGAARAEAGADRDIQRAGRQLTQNDRFFWQDIQQKNITHAMLYSATHYAADGGRKLRLKVGDNKLAKWWVDNAKSIWLPDGFSAQLTYDQGSTFQIWSQSVDFANSLMPNDDMTGRVKTIEIRKGPKFAESLVERMNMYRQDNSLPLFTLNAALSKAAFSYCQADAWIWGFYDITMKDLKQQLDYLGIANSGVALVREKMAISLDVIDQSWRMAQAMTKKKSSLRILKSKKWKEVGVGHAWVQEEPKKLVRYACSIFISK